MARASKRRPAKVQAATPPTEPIVWADPPPPLPEWFSAGPPTSDNRPRIELQRELAYHIVEKALDGKIALPTWQRPPVWSREQQVLLLDSLVRGWPCGSILIWRAPQDTQCIPLSGCPVNFDAWGRYLVLDGQQRVTALLAAARGELAVRWDGDRWGETGYLSAEQCFQDGGREGYWDYSRALHDHNHELWFAFIRAQENVHRADLQVIIIEGDEAAARDAYRRFNSTGTAHAAEHLARAEKPGSPQVASG
mgnify:FL=1